MPALLLSISVNLRELLILSEHGFLYLQNGNNSDLLIGLL